MRNILFRESQKVIEESRENWTEEDEVINFYGFVCFLIGGFVMFIVMLIII